jgi:uncharacterized protein (UPF0335 family)
MTTKGHNSDGIAHEQLRGIVERVERLQEEKDAIGADIREVFAAVLDLYRRALGMV